jgi:hypothetical protein
VWLIQFALVAQAAPEATSSPWKGSRWFIEIEETTPSPIELSAEDNFSFRTRAVQVQAVLSCPKAEPLGKKLEITCKIESLAWRSTPRTLQPDEALHPSNQPVLDSVVDRLQGTRVVFMLTPDGRVTTVDLPDVVANNRRESESREILRRVAYDLVAGFSLETPETLAAGSSWVEKNSALLRAPTEPALLGGTKTEHSLSQVEGVDVVQSTGSGSFTAPYIPWEFAYDGGVTNISGGSDGGARTSGGMGSGGPASVSVSAATSGRPVSSGPEVLATTPSEKSFSGTLTSVTVLAPGSKMPQERVWVMRAGATASSVGTMQGTSLYYAGRLRRLEPMEAVQMGPTEIIAPPGQKLEGIGTWVPMSTL